MALTYDLSACNESVEFLTSDSEWPITQTLIFQTMGIGIGDWKQADAAEIFSRIKFLEKIYGSFVYRTDEAGNRTDYFFTVEDIQRRIGLKTNVFPKETRSSFIKRHTNGIFQSLAWDFSQNKKNQEG